MGILTTCDPCLSDVLQICEILGVLLVINCFAYLAICLVSLVLPAYADGVSQALLLPEALGELSIMLWLLIRGVRVDHRTPVPLMSTTGQLRVSPVRDKSHCTI